MTKPRRKQVSVETIRKELDRRARVAPKRQVGKRGKQRGK